MKFYICISLDVQEVVYTLLEPSLLDVLGFNRGNPRVLEETTGDDLEFGVPDLPEVTQ